MSRLRNDLAALRDEIHDYLKSRNFTVFHGQPRIEEGSPGIFWDTSSYPDFRQFLEVAREAEVKIIHTAQRELTSGIIDAVVDDLGATELPRDEQEELRERLEGARPYAGFLCAVEVSFDHEGRTYVYLARTPWFEDFIDAAREVGAALEDFDPDEDDDESSMPPYFTKN
jgi:hypothetical protein